MLEFFAHGKLLLTAEYFVLDGAKALAFPTKQGQSLKFLVSSSKFKVAWKSLDHEGNIWFETEIDWHSLSLSNQNQVGKKLEEILRKARELNNEFLKYGGEITLTSDFNLQWGFGSSSTLISLISQWVQVDPYELQFACFGGSGYDIACATAKGPIIYSKLPKPSFDNVLFSPEFANQLYLVFLGKKQNSREGIKHYKNLEIAKRQDIILQLNAITEAILVNSDFEKFCSLLKQHETIISNALHLPKVQTQLFSDFKGQTKSLGAWGGDVILAASQTNEREAKNYFMRKGYNTILKWNECVLV